MEVKVGTTCATRGDPSARMVVEANTGGNVNYPLKVGVHRYRADGTYCITGAPHRYDLVEIPTQTITMDGKWAYARDPSVQVRILAVDRPTDNQSGDKCPVVSMDRVGGVYSHGIDGSGASHSLVKYIEPTPEPRTYFVNIHSDGMRHVYNTRAMADHSARYSDVETIKVVEETE